MYLAVACAARSADSAKEFAEKHGIGRYYGSYDDELLHDKYVDIGYVVGNIHLYRWSIGGRQQLVSVFSDLHFNAADSDPYPTSYLYNHDIGGGASLLLATYPLAFATLFFNGWMPESAKVDGQLMKGLALIYM